MEAQLSSTEVRASPDPDRSKNTYVREDQILPHLAALAILLAGHAGRPVRGSRGRAQLTGPDGTAALIGQLRADGTVLTYDPDGRTLRAGGPDAPAVTIGTDAVGTRLRQGKKRRTA
jgi:site-specific DNA recombinase